MRATQNKYGNRKVTYLGIEFDSMKEANRYAALLMLQRAGEISELKTQVSFELVPAQFEPDTVGPRGGIRRGACIEKAVSYVADSYTRTGKGRRLWKTPRASAPLIT
jgi:hypothetical protein